MLGFTFFYIKYISPLKWKYHVNKLIVKWYLFNNIITNTLNLRRLYHFPLGTDVRSRAKDDQETCLIGQIQKMVQISVAFEVVDALCLFMEVPGDITVWWDRMDRTSQRQHAMMPLRLYWGMQQWSAYTWIALRPVMYILTSLSFQ